MLGPAKNTWGCQKAGRRSRWGVPEFSETILREEHVSLSCSPLRYNQAGVVAAKVFQAIVRLSCSRNL